MMGHISVVGWGHSILVWNMFPYLLDLPARAPYRKGPQTGRHKIGKHMIGRHQVDRHKIGRHKIGRHKMDRHRMGRHRIGRRISRQADRQIDNEISRRISRQDDRQGDWQEDRQDLRVSPSRVCIAYVLWSTVARCFLPKDIYIISRSCALVY